MLSPNYVRGAPDSSFFESKILVKSPEPRIKSEGSKIKRSSKTGSNLTEKDLLYKIIIKEGQI